MALRKWGSLGELPFSIWDVDRDGKVTVADARQVIDMAYAIRRSDGGMLRLPTGFVANLNYYNHIDADHDGVIQRSEFAARYWQGPQKSDEAFAQRDINKNGKLDWDEMVSTGLLFGDAVENFLSHDTDLNGKVDQPELDAKTPDGQKQFASRIVALFDENGDGSLSFEEFRKVPGETQVPGIYGYKADGDHDARLSPKEFYKAPANGFPAFAVQLANLHFAKWDRDHDGWLTPEEFEFVYDKNAPRLTDPTEAARLATKIEGLTFEQVFQEPRPASTKISEVMDYTRRKMRFEEAFVSADANQDQHLDEAEERRYHELVEKVGSERAPAAEIPRGTRSRTWTEFGIYAVLTLCILATVIGGWRWASIRRNKK